jgi:cytosine/uracil/thiamine/allantoin permease
VYLTDWWLRRGQHVEHLLFDRKHNPWAGVVAMAVGMAVSIALFSNQTKYVGPVPSHVKAFGDITFEVGFVVSAVLYWIGYTVSPKSAQKVD